MSGAVADFATRVIDWQRTHGRRSLPWQGTRDPSRVWLSEIMLQQTQVATVLRYYDRFLERFPDVRALAAASQDDVLAMWSGLGYYSRARNLHRCAQQVVAQYGGEFPRSAAQLQGLPGIGRSTAAAIASFCFGERVAILDANVRRVLARVVAFEGDPGIASQQEELWRHATERLPRACDSDEMPRYTQGMMDLGAGICLPRDPQCLLCPVESLCAARGGDVHAYPRKTRKAARAQLSLWLLHARAGDRVWLVRRPDAGIWAGLHCLPEFASREQLVAGLPARYRGRLQEAPAMRHILTHRELDLRPVAAQLPQSALSSAAGSWFSRAELESVALPSPIRRLLSL